MVRSGYLLAIMFLTGDSRQDRPPGATPDQLPDDGPNVEQLPTLRSWVRMTAAMLPRAARGALMTVKT